MGPEPALLARRIAALIERHGINITTEIAAQQRIGQLLAGDGLSVQAEVALNARDRIDFLCGSVGIEVKISGGRRRDIFRQLERYAASARVGALVIATGGAWPSGMARVGGKPLLFASLNKGWL